MPSDGITSPRLAEPIPPRRPLMRVPRWEPIPSEHYGHVSPEAEILAGLEVLRRGPVAVLTGAGMSTDSGLADYRGPNAVPRTPMTYQEFMASDMSRRRYWARSTVGWDHFTRARPNQGHQALARLGELLTLTGIITQNVDGLHQKAGSRDVIDLHGTLHIVVCQQCGARVDRADFHAHLMALNPGFDDRVAQLPHLVQQNPDGDAELEDTEDFAYPDCARCGGIMKPDVVFFGENAHRTLVAQSFAAVDAAHSMLVLGTSLSVQSGLRFVRRAAKAGRPVVIVNDGPTRGDQYATVRIKGRLDQVLSRWVRECEPIPAPQ